MHNSCIGMAHLIIPENAHVGIDFAKGKDQTVINSNCPDFVAEEHNSYPLCDNTKCDKSSGCDLSAHNTTIGYPYEK